MHWCTLLVGHCEGDMLTYTLIVVFKKRLSVHVPPAPRPIYSPFAQESYSCFCYDGLRHTHKYIKVIGQPVCMRVLTHTHSSDSMTPTADAGGNEKVLGDNGTLACDGVDIFICLWTMLFS